MVLAPKPSIACSIVWAGTPSRSPKMMSFFPLRSRFSFKGHLQSMDSQECRCNRSDIPSLNWVICPRNRLAREKRKQLRSSPSYPPKPRAVLVVPRAREQGHGAFPPPRSESNLPSQSQTKSARILDPQLKWAYCAQKQDLSQDGIW